MRVGSLFSGCGGFELGLERAGFETAWFVENEPHAQAVLKKNWPTTPIYGDITELDFTAVPPIDILTGGFPCQDISNAGKRAGITGSRSGLWKYYLQAIRVLQPRLVLAENVSALIDRGLDVVLADLAEIGYDAEWHCFPASSVGAPHRRDRIIIMAYPNGERRVHGQAPEQSDSRREYALGDARESGQDVADTDSRGLERTSKEERGTGDAFRCSGEGSKNQDVADTDCGRRNEGSEWQHNNSQEWSICKDESDDGNGVWGESRTSDSHAGWWAVEPSVGRVAHGVPLRVDRIKRLGNAAVPQWAQAIGEAIKESEVLK
jgi:DNA (cytosine-5)-methyltransferase 1